MPTGDDNVAMYLVTADAHSAAQNPDGACDDGPSVPPCVIWGANVHNIPMTRADVFDLYGRRVARFGAPSPALPSSAGVYPTPPSPSLHHHRLGSVPLSPQEMCNVLGDDIGEVCLVIDQHFELPWCTVNAGATALLDIAKGLPTLTDHIRGYKPTRVIITRRGVDKLLEKTLLFSEADDTAHRQLVCAAVRDACAQTTFVHTHATAGDVGVVCFALSGKKSDAAHVFHELRFPNCTVYACDHNTAEIIRRDTILLRRGERGTFVVIANDARGTAHPDASAPAITCAPIKITTGVRTASAILRAKSAEEMVEAMQMHSTDSIVPLLSSTTPFAQTVVEHIQQRLSCARNADAATGKPPPLPRPIAHGVSAYYS